MSDDVDPFATLLAAARGGDKSAWGKLLAAHRAALRAGARRRLPKEIAAGESASDVVQQTLAAAFQARERFVGDDPAQLRAWLFGILSNVVRQAMARHGRRTAA